MSSKARKSKCKEPSLEDYYQNKVFIKPAEKSLETIFEEPRVSRDGVEKLTSTKKFRRSLRCDEWPTAEKLRKRKKKIKKYFSSTCRKNLKTVKIVADSMLHDLMSEPGNTSLRSGHYLKIHEENVSGPVSSLVTEIIRITVENCRKGY